MLIAFESTGIIELRVGAFVPLDNVIQNGLDLHR